MGKAFSQNPLKVENDWLGNFLLHIGMSEEEILEGSIRCRGSVIELRNDDEETLKIVTETAWSPMLKVITTFCERYAADPLQYLYTAEELGNGILESNDSDVVGSILFDVWEHNDALPKVFNELEYDTFEEEEARDRMFEALKMDPDNSIFTEDLMRKTNEKFGEYMSVHQYEFCDIEDLE